ncbi:oligosaccharide repeat unit polymerase [Verrucomicrobia bacterium]|nr:oligosaccharide repeat unit polymerase [Verrucomicrobiota bacterium]MDA7657488.1 oligosaccharide repeat unit polymerase [Verrucomicrobiota bacterium]
MKRERGDEVTSFTIILWFIVGAISVGLNRDLLSPTKVYLVSLVIYFGNVIIENYAWEVDRAVLLLVILAGILALLEGKGVETRRRREALATRKIGGGFKVRSNAVLIIWIVSSVPVLVQFYLVASMGGFYAYASAVKSSVVEMRGLGIYFTVIRMLPALNMCYLFLILGKEKNLKFHLPLYVLHLAILIGLGLFANSRSSVLYPILFGAVVYHYRYMRLNIIYLTTLLLGAVLGVAFLGVVREIYSFDKDVIVDFSGRESMFIWSGFRYGLVGIETVYQMGVTHLYMGWTYLTVFTNFVPRFLWPGKPDPGGVIFTKEYLADQWAGLSYATPGVLGESMMNFGLDFGLIMGLLILCGLNYFLIWIYRKYVSGDLDVDGRFVRDRFILVKYVILLNYVNALLVGEFTNTTVSVIVPLVYVCFYERILFCRVGAGLR